MAYMNFPEVWETRVREQITSADQAPFFEGIDEFNSEITVMGAGTAGEQNLIHIPLADIDPKVFINNTTYPLPVVEYSDKGMVVALDKYQTEVTSVPDDAIIGASYDRIDVTTKKHVSNINAKKIQKGVHALAPKENTTDTPVLIATGPPDPTGRPTLTYNDLVYARGKLGDIDTPEEDRRLILNNDHFNDLLLDRKNFGDQLVNYNTGKPAPIIAGFKIYSYINNPLFDVTTKTKKPFGAVATDNDRKASVMFYGPNTGKKTGLTKQYYLPSELNPSEQSNKLNYRHYFIITPIRYKYLGAIV